MGAKRRSEVFIADEVGVYHCWNKLVRGQYLFGFDPLSGKDYSHRKDEAKNEFKKLAANMAIDVLDYAITRFKFPEGQVP